MVPSRMHVHFDDAKVRSMSFGAIYGLVHLSMHATSMGLFLTFFTNETRKYPRCKTARRDEMTRMHCLEPPFFR